MPFRLTKYKNRGKMLDMRIVILGAGRIGVSLIRELLQEEHEITVIDVDAERLNYVANKYDVKGLVGKGVSRENMLSVGVDKADFFIACTSQDEVNVICALLAKKLGAKKTIARVRDPEYYKEMKIMKDDFYIDLVFNPEYRTAKEISKILKFPSAEHVESFASGKASMMDICIADDNPIVDKSVMEVVKKYDTKVIMASVKRGNEVYIPLGDFVFNKGDVLSVIGKDTFVADFCKKIKIFKAPAKSVFIVGGGKIGFYLAQELESSGIDVKIIEKDQKRCETLTNELENATVLLGDAGDKNLLIEEGLSKTDACVTLTGMDEENAIISLYAKEMNVDKIITKAERPFIKKMLDTLGLDTVVIPQEVIANHMVRFVRASSASLGEEINTLYRLSDDVEALEFTVQDGFSTGVPIKDLKIKKGVLIGGIVRRGDYVLPTGNTTFEKGDRVIVVAPTRTISSLKEILQ